MFPTGDNAMDRKLKNLLVVFWILWLAAITVRYAWMIYQVRVGS